MDYEAIRNLPEMFFEQAESLADRPFLWVKRDRNWLRPTKHHLAATEYKHHKGNDDCADRIDMLDGVECQSASSLCRVVPEVTRGPSVGYFVQRDSE